MMDKLLNKIVVIAQTAGAKVMEIYQRDFQVYEKADKSPLTEADLAAQKIISTELSQIANYPILAEEQEEIPYEDRKDWQTFWLVDPIDGTKEFIKKNGEFTVNIALIEKGVPVMGVVHLPACDITFFGNLTSGAYKKSPEKLEVLTGKKLTPQDTFYIAGSRSHQSVAFTDYLEKEVRPFYPKIEIVSVGSSIKMCLLAEGKVDLYPRLGPTSEWDTGAGHAILKAVGKEVYDFNSNLPLTYNKKSIKNSWFIAK